jgi:pyruvate dehydrogenase E1 component beta subunit
MPEIRFGKALNLALAEMLEQDPEVFLLGEDIAEAGGSFGVTRGLYDRFGFERVRDTPISEAAMANVAVGAALTGLKPVLEIMFMDFVALTMDALVNQAAKSRYMFGGQNSVPMVLRTPHGGGLSAGPQHSQCLEAWLAHVPGLKVLCPSNPADAYGMLKSAIQDADPVVFVENKSLYAKKGNLANDAESVPIGRARTVREGSDATVLAYGAAVHKVESAAQALADQGLEIELLDLRSIQPWDEAAVLQSLSRTHRLLIVHEAVEAFGVGAEIAARIGETGFDELDAPIMRVGAPFTPVPFAPSMEQEYQPGVDDVVDAVGKLCA